MSDRPTPKTAPLMHAAANESIEAVFLRGCDLERQRNAYAYTLRVILKSAGQHVSDAIRHTHPELAP